MSLAQLKQRLCWFVFLPVHVCQAQARALLPCATGAQLCPRSVALPCPGRTEVVRGGLGDPRVWSPQATVLGLWLCSLLG